MSRLNGLSTDDVVMEKMVAASAWTRTRKVCILAGIVFLLLLGSVLLERLYVASSSKALQKSDAPNEPLPLLIGSSYSERELLPYKAEGTGSIAGQAYLVRGSADEKIYARAPIFLVPDVPHTHSWYEKFVLEEANALR